MEDAMNYPEQIEDVALQLSQRTREVQDLREQVTLRESAATLEVLNARDEQGRALYSNETARNAAIKLALSSNNNYQELERRLTAAETERSQLLARIERLRGEFRLHLLDRQQEIAAMGAEPA